MTVTSRDVRAAVDAMFKSAAYSSFWSRDDMAILAEAALRSYAEGNPMVVEIVKVQVPLTRGSPRTCLVYEEARKHMVEMPLPNPVKKALNGDPKGYFKAAWSSIVGWGISERVEDRDW